MKTVGTILIGSQNYSLDIAESDRDYKIVVTPNFDELYLKNDLNGAAIPFGDPGHYSCMDVRSFANNLAKGNPNAIEMLFSTEIEDEFADFHHLLEKWREPYFKGYVASQWSYFTQAIGGIIYNGFKRYGLTPKTASRAAYFTFLITHIEKNNFVINEEILRAMEVCYWPRYIRTTGAVAEHGIDFYIDEYRNVISGIDVKETPDFNPEIFITPTKEFVRRNM